MELLGVPVPDVNILGGPEPVLIAEGVKGSPWAGVTPDQAILSQVGAHCAIAYLIANADLRPRNSLLDLQSRPGVMHVIDFEHCFFDRALAVEDIANPHRPESIDALEDRVEGLTRRRVLTPAATRRARRSFLANDDRLSCEAIAFKTGWLEMYHSIKSRRSELEALLQARVYSEPPLIIGTRGYRRAMARIDIRDMMQRIDDDAMEAFDRCY